MEQSTFSRCGIRPLTSYTSYLLGAAVCALAGTDNRCFDAVCSHVASVLSRAQAGTALDGIIWMHIMYRTLNHNEYVCIYGNKHFKLLNCYCCLSVCLSANSSESTTGPMGLECCILFKNIVGSVVIYIWKTSAEYFLPNYCITRAKSDFRSSR